MTVTDGRTRSEAARIYDRLRKRSYRKRARSADVRYYTSRHRHYVAGVRDALNAIVGGDK